MRAEYRQRRFLLLWALLPLALLAQMAGTTVSHPGGEEQPQRAIRFAALFGRTQAE